MTTRAYIQKNFRPTSLAMVELINRILAEYQAQGYDLSLRQLYYQLVARDIIDNNQREYKRLGTLVSDARLAGMIDWDMIKDRGRETVRNSHWEHPADILKSAATGFRLDKWKDQPYRVRVMVEKQALEGVLIPVCRELDIPFTANKGYTSSSAMYETGQEIQGTEQKTVILYLGDHDPSGIDMTRDVKERASMFAERRVIVKRIALNFPQIEQWKPPPNPTKDDDRRTPAYIQKYGTSCWELDAIEPAVLADLVRQTVLGYRQEGLWEKAVKAEKQDRAKLEKLAQDWGTA